MEIQTDRAYWEELYRRYLEWIETFNQTRLLRININEYDVNNEESIDLLIAKIENILNA